MANPAKTDAPAEPANVTPTNALVVETCKQIEALYGELETLKGAYMEQCKELREQMADTYIDAKSRGVNTQALKAVVKIRKLERKLSSIEEGVGPEISRTYEAYRKQIGPWGDTPLGQAAAE